MSMAPRESLTTDAAEIEKFSALADSWWDEAGPFKPLHLLNPVRIAYIRDAMSTHLNLRATPPLSGARILDVGSGGGLLAEPLSRLGAAVTGIDASEKNIKIAALHAQQEGLSIDYQATAIEAFSGNVQNGNRPAYDAVLAMEILEHVADVPLFIHHCSQALKPGGLLFFATINRTLKSLALAKFGAEYILRWLPIGTHDWQKFLKPSEIILEGEKHGLQLLEMRGVSYQPWKQHWALSDDLSMNFMLVMKKADKN